MPVRGYSSPDRIADGVAFLVPLALLGGLALGGGGFDLLGRHLAGIASWIAVAALVVSSRDLKPHFGLRFKVVASLLLALVLLSTLSSVWSSSVHNSLVEAERIIAYLGFFLLGYVVCRGERQRQYFVWGLIAALGFILLLALGSRLLPGSGVPSGFVTARLSFPLGYWNADGLLFGLAFVAFGWASRECSRPIVRWAVVASTPAALTGLYLTYSRGGAIAAIIALVSVFFLSRDRLWITTVAAIGLACSIPVIMSVQANPAIADNLGGADAPGQGLQVLAVLVAAMIGAAIIFWVFTVIASRLPRATSRLVALTRKRQFLMATALAGITLVGVLAIAFGGRVWTEFSGASIHFPSDPEAHFTQLSGAGRYQFNQVAIDTFADNPVLGTGAGTYRFEWAIRRPIDLVAQDAHSIYLEAFSDLGVPGGLLVLALAAAAIWTALAAWRRSDSRSRGFEALMIASLITTLVAFGIDWFWELGATAAFLMLIFGWLAAASEDVQTKGLAHDSARWVILPIAWAAIVLLAVPAAADRYMTSGIKATEDGQLGKAVNRARTASQLDPFWARPHMQLGVLAQFAGLERQAIAEFDRAIQLDPDNWQTWYLRSRAETALGRDSAAERDLEQARRKNPRAPELQGG